MTIYLEDERLIRDGETAVSTYIKSTGKARDQIIPMARGLLAARRRYVADREFGQWLAKSPYSNIGNTERAALIKIGEYEPIMIEFINSTTRVSPRTIWDEYRDACGEPAKASNRASKEVGFTLAKKDRLDIKKVDFLIKQPVHEIMRQAAFDKKITMQEVLRRGLKLWLEANGYDFPDDAVAMSSPASNSLDHLQ